MKKKDQDLGGVSPTAGETGPCLVHALELSHADLLAHYEAALSNWREVIRERDLLKEEVASLTDAVLSINEEKLAALYELHFGKKP